jgi:microsomal dipeptidase-like Zn-dependent dipeptidase
VRGEQALKYMWDRGMMVELNHMSELMTRDVITLA